MVSQTDVMHPNQTLSSCDLKHVTVMEILTCSSCYPGSVVHVTSCERHVSALELSRDVSVSPRPGLEPYMAHCKPRPHPVFPKHCAGVAAMPLPVGVRSHLPHLPPQPRPGLHMHESPQQS